MRVGECDARLARLVRDGYRCCGAIVSHVLCAWGGNEEWRAHPMRSRSRRETKARWQSSAAAARCSGETSPMIIVSMRTGQRTAAPRAPWMPQSVQSAILSLQDMHAVGGESTRPGFVRKTPRRE